MPPQLSHKTGTHQFLGVSLALLLFTEKIAQRTSIVLGIFCFILGLEEKSLAVVIFAIDFDFPAYLSLFTNKHLLNACKAPNAAC